MRDNGKLVERGTIARHNLKAQRVLGNPQQSIIIEGRHLKILIWESWREATITIKETPNQEKSRETPLYLL